MNSVLLENEPPSTELTQEIPGLVVKKVLICLHGFQSSKEHDLKAFKDYFESLNDNPNLEVCLVDLFEFGEKETYNSKKMFRKADETVRDYLAKGYVVYMLAYSFSVGIAARICSEHPEIEKLVLVSPTIYLIKTGLLQGYISLLIKHMKVTRMMKKRKRMLKASKTMNPGFFILAIAIAASIRKNRKYLKKLSCKVFIFKGSEDELPSLLLSLMWLKNRKTQSSCPKPILTKATQ